MRLVSTVVLLLLMVCTTARAQPPAHVVTNCQNAQQPGIAPLFDVVRRVASLPTPRPVIFDCPADTVIQINPGPGMEIRGPVVIDGQNKITLDAPGMRQAIFTVPSGFGASLTLKNIRIRGAQLAPGTSVASVIATHEALLLENVTIEGSEAPIVAFGDITVRQSRFTGNTGTVLQIGDTTREGGAVVIEDSQFHANAGPAVNGGRTISVRASQFVGNERGVGGKGGTIRGSLFQSNTIAVVFGGHVDSELRGNTFEKNGTGLLVMFEAGASTTARMSIARNLFSGQTTGGIVMFERGMAAAAVGARIDLDVVRNRFLNNRTEQNGGAIGVTMQGMVRQVSMQARGNVFRDNSAKEHGGAVFWGAGRLTIRHSVFGGNRAAAGGAVFVRPPAGMPVTIANSLIVESSGTAIDVPMATIVNATIARNKGPGVVFREPMGGAEISNTIFDQNAGGNCLGLVARHLPRGNLQFGAGDCPGVRVVNPFLDTFYVPSPGSAAAEAGSGGTCTQTPVDGVDLLFQRRGAARCSSGAYERPPVRIMKMVAAKAKNARTCPDGAAARPGQPCVEPVKLCSSGQVVPASVACPSLPHGATCSTSSECSNGVPCTSGRCRFP